MRVFDDMEASGLDADLHAYNSLIGACASAGSWEMVLFLSIFFQSPGGVGMGVTHCILHLIADPCFPLVGRCGGERGDL